VTRGMQHRYGHAVDDEPTPCATLPIEDEEEGNQRAGLAARLESRQEGKPNNRSHARHADAADDGRRRGPDVAGLGVEDVVQLGEERREEGEGGAGGEDAPAQHRAGGRAVAEPADVLGVVRVPDRASQQAELRDHERDPALRPRRKSTAG
jgi:hypothetical protein